MTSHVPVDGVLLLQSRLQELLKLQDQFDGGSAGTAIVSADRELVHKDKVKVISLKSGKTSDKVIHLVSGRSTDAPRYVKTVTYMANK